MKYIYNGGFNVLDQCFYITDVINKINTQEKIRRFNKVEETIRNTTKSGRKRQESSGLIYT